VLDQQIGVGVILVIDTSGSMVGNAIAQARNAARAFVESLAGADQAAVISFADAVVVESGLTADRGQTLAALDGLVAVGNTALYSGVVEAINQARSSSTPRRAIILLSDGQDFGGASQADEQEALTLASEARIPIYAIGLGQDIDRPFLEELARASNGAFFEAPAPSLIPEIYDQLSQILRSQYVVTLEATAPADIEERDISLTVSTPSGQVVLTTDYTTRRTILPTAVPVSPTASPSPTPTPALAVAPTEDDSGGGGFMLPLLLLVLGGGGVGLGYVYYKRVQERRRLAQDIEVLSRKAADELAQDDYVPPRVTVAGPTRTLKLTGPGIDQSFEVGDEPVTLGTSSECQIRLEEGEGAVAVQHARVWLRDGNLMLHHLAPLHESLVGGRPVSWVSLETGDEVDIGPYRLLVEP
jgi:uncharacterized protein YegL